MQKMKDKNLYELGKLTQNGNSDTMIETSKKIFGKLKRASGGKHACT